MPAQCGLNAWTLENSEMSLGTKPLGLSLCRSFMSACGTWRTLQPHAVMSALESKADLTHDVPRCPFVTQSRHGLLDCTCPRMTHKITQQVLSRCPSGSVV